MHSARRVRDRAIALLAVAGVLAAALALAGQPTPASASRHTTSSATNAWRWPLTPEPQVVRGFVRPPRPWLAGHRGADLVARPGQPVLAPALGRVAFSGTVVDRGVLTIQHVGGLVTSLEPVVAGVARGDVVVAGQQVAVIGTGRSHCPPEPCLHWGVRRHNVYLDPLLMLRPPPPPVLLPWSGRPVGPESYPAREAPPSPHRPYATSAEPRASPTTTSATPPTSDPTALAAAATWRP